MSDERQPLTYDETRRIAAELAEAEAKEKYHTDPNPQIVMLRAHLRAVLSLCYSKVYGGCHGCGKMATPHQHFDGCPVAAAEEAVK